MKNICFKHLIVILLGMSYVSSSYSQCIIGVDSAEAYVVSVYEYYEDGAQSNEMCCVFLTDTFGLTPMIQHNDFKELVVKQEYLSTLYSVLD